MNVLFLTLGKFKSINQEGIYHDFVKELSNHASKVIVVSPIEKREKQQNYTITQDNIEILRINTGNLLQTNKLTKAVNIMLLEKRYKAALNKNYGDLEFDLIIYSTPPMTFSKLISKVKAENDAISYLMLKDIFPQNAVDLKMFKKNGLIYKYFRRKEIETYKNSDLIGVMSKRNKTYLLSENPDINPKTVSIFRNATYDYSKNKKTKREDIKKDLGINEKNRMFIYGGNIGAPQGIHNIKTMIKNFYKVKNASLVIVGDGTKFKEIQSFSEGYENVHVFENMVKEKYDELLNISDIGLIFLDENFEIPNYPSRLTSYLCLSKPVIAATDRSTDLGEEIEKQKCGLWNFSPDIDRFIENANHIISEDSIYNAYAKNAYQFFKEEFTIEKNLKNMMFEINKFKEQISDE